MRIRSLTKTAAALFVELAAMTALAAPAAKSADAALLNALRAADDSLAVSLIDRQANANVRDETGATALMWAVQRHNLDMANRLLQAGADPNLVGENGVGPLQLAVTNRLPEIATLLLDKGAKANVAREEGETALMAAARTGQLDVMKKLLEHGADVNAKEKMFHQTALMWSAGRPEQVRLLIANGADLKARTKTWDVTNTLYTPPTETIGITGIPWNNDGEFVSKKGGQTALFFAVQKNDIESVGALLDAGMDVNEAAADGSTPLLLALYKWSKKFEARKDQIGPLMPKLPFDPNLKIANLLLDRGAKVDVHDAIGYTPLHGAVLAMLSADELGRTWRRNNDEDEDKPSKEVGVDAGEGLAMVKRLLDLQADPNDATRYPTPGPIGAIRINPAPAGSSPLHIAALSDNLQLMDLLIQRGGDPNLLRQDGHSPLSVAVKGDNLPVTRLLVAHGGDIKRTYDPGDHFGEPDKPISRPRSQQSLLHIAAGAGAFNMIPFLVEQGVPLDSKNDKGETALQLADAQERFRFVRDQEAIDFDRAVRGSKTDRVAKRKTDTTDAFKNSAPEIE